MLAHLSDLKAFCLCVLITLTACAPRSESSADQDSIPVSKAADITADAEAWADSVCASLSLRQKVAQLFIPALFASDDFWTLRQLRQYADSCIGGVLLLKGDSHSAAIIADSLQTNSRIPAFVAIDAEWGLAMRLTDAPKFPLNSDIRPDVNDQILYDYGRELARECRIIGVNMVLGPVVDVSFGDSFMRRRSFGDDPHRVADLALAYARGLEDGNVISVAKHFPGHGSVSADSHLRKGVIERSLNQMDSIDLYPFRRWVENRLSGIMVGHLAVPSIDSRMLPAAVSPIVIKDLLRGDMAFSGLVITDALNMKGAEGYGADDAIAAGADIVIAPEKTFSQIDKVMKAIAEGKISQSDIDTHVRRILFYKYLLNRSNPGAKSPPPATTTQSHDTLTTPQADSISHLLR